jgi:hypothetical protein
MSSKGSFSLDTRLQWMSQGRGEVILWALLFSGFRRLAREQENAHCSRGIHGSCDHAAAVLCAGPLTRDGYRPRNRLRQSTYLYLVQISRSDCARIDRASSGSLGAEFLNSFGAFLSPLHSQDPVSGSGVLTHCGPSSGVLSPGFLAAFSASSLGMSFSAFDHCVLRCHRVTVRAPLDL